MGKRLEDPSMRKVYRHTFWLNKEEDEMADELCNYYDCNRSELIRMLVKEKYILLTLG